MKSASNSYTANQCGFRADGKTEKTRCQHPATHRSPTVARCHLHGGHHDYTERWNGSQWERTDATGDRHE